MNKAIFLDKDGTLIKNIPYNISPNKIRFLPNVLSGLRQLKQLGYKLVIVSNQSGVAKGYFNEYELQLFFHSFVYTCKRNDVTIDGWYYCPHSKDGSVQKYAVECNCRKPEAGLLIKAADELNVDITESWMIGDILHDVEAGNKVGCKTILIANGNETEWNYSPFRLPRYVVDDFSDAVRHIRKEYFKEREDENYAISI